MEQLKGTRTMLKVSGYLNSLNDQKRIIPKVIVDMIVLFSQQSVDKFISAIDIEFLQCDCVAMIGTKISQWSAILSEMTILCQGGITQHNGIYKWRFNIQSERVSIGIVSGSYYRNEIKYCFCSYHWRYYAITDNGEKEWNNSYGISGAADYRNYCDKIKKNDQIVMTFNTKNRTLSFNKNGQDLGVAFDDVDYGKYRMAVCIRGSIGDYIELVDCNRP